MSETSTSIIHRYPVLIKEQYLDSLGHMNNAAYLILYEEARWDLITKGGYGYKVVHETGIGPVILDLKVSFLREIVLRETIEITTETKSYNGKVGVLLQKMVKADGKIASEAEFTFGTLDLRARKLVAPPDAWLRLLGK